MNAAEQVIAEGLRRTLDELARGIEVLYDERDTFKDERDLLSKDYEGLLAAGRAWIKSGRDQCSGHFYNHEKKLCSTCALVTTIRGDTEEAN